MLKFYVNVLISSTLSQLGSVFVKKKKMVAEFKIIHLKLNYRNYPRYKLTGSAVLEITYSYFENKSIEKSISKAKKRQKNILFL